MEFCLGRILPLHLGLVHGGLRTTGGRDEDGENDAGDQRREEQFEALT